MPSIKRIKGIDREDLVFARPQLEIEETEIIQDNEVCRMSKGSKWLPWFILVPIDSPEQAETVLEEEIKQIVADGVLVVEFFSPSGDQVIETWKIHQPKLIDRKVVPAVTPLKAGITFEYQGATVELLPAPEDGMSPS